MEDIGDKGHRRGFKNFRSANPTFSRKITSTYQFHGNTKKNLKF